MTVKFTNNANSTLASGINSSVTSMTVADASSFPSLSGANDYCYLTLQESGGTTREIVKATARSSNTFTVVRGQDNTSAATWSSGILVELRITSALLQDVIDGLGSGSMMDTDIFAGDGSDTTFTLSRQPDNENNLLIFIDGVFQAHNAYSVSGTTLTLSAAPANGRVITAYHMATTVGGSNLVKATMTGDNSDVTLDVGSQILHENNVQVYFDGVYQSKGNYSVSGSVITFSTAPPTGVAVEAILNTATNISTAAQVSDADSDTKIQVEESSDEDKIRFDIAGTEEMVMDATGIVINDGSNDRDFRIESNGYSHMLFVDGGANTVNIGGSTDQGGLLNLEGYDSDMLVLHRTADTGDQSILFKDHGDHNATITGKNGGALAFATNGNTEAVRIDSSGRVLIGFDTADTLYGGVVPALQVEGTGAHDSSIGMFRNSNDGSGPTLSMGKSRGTAVNSDTIVQSGDFTGTIAFTGADGGERMRATAAIKSSVDGTPGDNDMPGRLTFWTTPDGGYDEVERMRIQNSGITQFKTGDGNSGIAEFHTNASSGNTSAYISIRPQGTVKGYIGNGSSLLSGSNVDDFIFRSENNAVINSGGNSESIRADNDGAVTKNKQAANKVWLS